MNIEIGSYEAKTKLPELLRGVQAGNHYTITSRGKPVASLGPAGDKRGVEPSVAVAQMRKIMLSASSSIHIDIKALIEEGRR